MSRHMWCAHQILREGVAVAENHILEILETLVMETLWKGRRGGACEPPVQMQINKRIGTLRAGGVDSSAHTHFIGSFSQSYNTYNIFFHQRGICNQI